MKRVIKVVLVAGIVATLGLMGLMPAAAQQPAVSVMRSFNPSSVPAGGGMVTVTVEITGSYGVGSVVETLPAGFTYVDGSVTPSDITPAEDGRKVSFPLLGESSFSYSVDTSTSSDRHGFSGELTYGIDKTKVLVLGETIVTVQAAAQQPAVSVMRSFNPSSVPAGGGMVTVTVEITGSYGVGSVVETLPAGFTYVDGSVTPSDITPAEDGRKVSFPLLGESSFSYSVDTSTSSDRHGFSGELTYGIDKTKVLVLGETIVTVQAAAQQPAVSVMRSFNPSSVPAGGGMVTVTVEITGSYGVGSVVETLPAGFTYVDGSVTPSDITPAEDGRKVSFPLLGESSFSYSVDTSTSSGRHGFSGELTYGIDKTKVPVLGETIVTVQAAAAPDPTPPSQPPVNRSPRFSANAVTRSVAENSASGTNVGARVRATDADRDTLIYALSGADAGSFTIGRTDGQIEVDSQTTLDYETKDSYMVTVRATDPDNASDTISVTITVVNVDEMGTVTLSSTAPRVGAAITASVTDPDGVVTGETWQWARSADGSTGWADTGATSAAYTPVQADEDNYLRATASYTDGEGSGKSAEAVSDNAVAGVPGDTNNDGRIDKPEVIAAYRAYVADPSDKTEMIAIFRQYVADSVSSE